MNDSIRKLRINSLLSLLGQVVTLISGVILPKYILEYYGSDVNGLQASINQFLSVIVFLEMGVGATVQSALYRPVANGEIDRLSEIVVSAKGFFKNIARILMVYVLLLVIFYPRFVESPLDYLSTVFLILSMSIGYFVQYYFGLVDSQILNANQQNYIPIGWNIVATIFNLLLSILLIKSGKSIVVVKFVSGLTYLLRPIMVNLYVNKNFEIDYTLPYNPKAIPQKWNGIANHISYTITNSTDIIILTTFSTLEMVSVYSVYNMVMNGVKTLLSSVTGNLQSFYGGLIARDEYDNLNNYFDTVEWICHTAIIFVFAMCAILITLFVKVYVSGTGNEVYNQPLFGMIFSIASAVYSIRHIYNQMIQAAGHYKQTQTSSIIEAVINVGCALMLVKRNALVGLALASLIASFYRVIYLIYYLQDNILKRPLKKFFKQAMVDIISFAGIVIVATFIPNDINSFLEWVKLAIVYGLISIVFMAVINYIFYKGQIIAMLNKIFKR